MGYDKSQQYLTVTILIDVSKTLTRYMGKISKIPLMSWISYPPSIAIPVSFLVKYHLF